MLILISLAQTDSIKLKQAFWVSFPIVSMKFFVRETVESINTLMGLNVSCFWCLSYCHISVFMWLFIKLTLTIFSAPIVPSTAAVRVFCFFVAAGEVRDIHLFVDFN